MQKSRHPIDEFFRESLEDYGIKPDGEARKAFLAEATRIPPPPGRGRKGWILFIVALMATGSALVIWLNRPTVRTTIPSGTATAHSAATHNSYAPLPEARHVETVQSTPSSVAGQSSPKVPVKEVKHIANNQTRPGPKNPEQPERQSILPTQQPASASRPPVVKSATPGVPVQPDSERRANPEITAAAEDQSTAPAIDASPSTALVSAASPATSPEPVSSISSKEVPPGTSDPGMEGTPSPSNRPVSDSLTPVSGNNRSGGGEENPDKKWFTLGGVFYTPEWMFNTLENTNFASDFGLEGAFHFGRFSIRTGVGLSIGKGTHEVLVEYNDYLGAYNRLDSMKFKWDPSHQDFTPTMYLSRQKVWDSLMKLDSAKVVKRYTYLQIPLLLGYSVPVGERFAVGLHAGPILSVLLASRTLSAPYDPGNKRVVSVNDISPEQINLNWQAMAGISATWFLTRKLWFELEPEARYYFNSVYEKPASETKPWSFGVRAAIGIKIQ